MGASSNKKYKEKKKIKESTNQELMNYINSQFKQSVCKIYINENECGTGFLCKIPFPDEFILLPALITNNHIINEEYLNKNKKIKISFDEGKIIKFLKIIPERKFFSKETYDISIIQIIPNKDDLNLFLELDFNFDENENKVNKDIYLLKYPKGNESCASFGKIKDIKEYKIEHTCSKEDRSSGGPIILLETFKVIGVHKGSEEDNIYGVLLKYPINEFYKNFEAINKKKDEIRNVNNGKKNEIIVKLKIEKEDINKDIYILNNLNYANSDGIIHEVDELKEINKENTLLFVDNKEVEYEKYIKFDKIGTHEIKIKLKINLINANCMFFGCKNIIDIDLSAFNTQNMINMKAMFSCCNNLENINFSSFDTKNVLNMSAMFYSCNNLTNINLSSFDTKNVTDIGCMFCGCNNLTKINLSSFETKNITNMGNIFDGCNNLTTINLSSSFDTKNVTNMYGMFYCCNNLINFNLSSFDTKNVTDIGCMFFGCNSLTNINLSSFDTKNVTNMGSSFYGCSNLTIINLPSTFDTKNVTNMYGMFCGCHNLININLLSFDTKNVSDMGCMFSCCYKLTNINLSSFDTKNVTNMNSMFDGCNNLININLSSLFVTKNVTDMNGMFKGCNILTNIDLSSFDTKNVTDMGYMFYDCNNLININLSSFDTKNVTDMGSMFYGCNNLSNVDLSSFKSEKNLESFKNIFFNCFKLKKLKISQSFYKIIKPEIQKNIQLNFIN